MPEPQTEAYQSFKSTTVDSTPTVVSGQLSATRFSMVKEHARGGLGKVSLARDLRLNRPVAIKEIRPDRLGNAELRERFLTEAEITSQLQHPGIVPIYGLEEDAAGQPYYAMRFVEGKTLAEAIREFHKASNADYADERRVDLCANQRNLRLDFASLAFRELLQRFVSVCQTIAYAHAKGVIHRDLKPANVMLGDYGETLVLDWGLAKRVVSPECQVLSASTTVASSRLTSQDSGLTEAGQVLGTANYMSPEQAAGEPVGPATDVYALGAILYEALTGRPPFVGRSTAEVVALVRTTAPPAPSARLAGIPKPLEAICARAISRDPRQRYATGTALASDVQHWLADEPVSCHAEPWIARAGRWARKHKTFVISAGAVLGVVALAALVGLVIVGRFNNRLATAIGNLDVANTQLEWKNTELEASITNEKQERAKAVAAEGDTQAFSNFLVDHVLAASRPKGVLAGLGVDVRMSEALQAAEQSIATVFAGRPRAEAAARQAIGVTWRNLGKYAEAERHLRRTVELRQQHLDANDPDLLDGMNSLALALNGAGKSNDAIPLLERVRDAELAKYGPEHSNTLTTLNNLATAYRDAGKTEEAINLYERVRDAQTRHLGPSHHSTLTTLSNLASAYQDADRAPDAIVLLERARVGFAAQYGTDHAYTLTALNNLALAYRSARQPQKAIKLFEQVRDARSKVLGEEHQETLVTLNNLALAYLDVGKLPETLALLEQVYDAQTRTLRPDHPDTLATLNNLADANLVGGKADKALELFKQASVARLKELGPDHADTLASQWGLADALLQVGKKQEALQLFDELVPKARARFTPLHQKLMGIETGLVLALEANQRWDRVAAERQQLLAKERVYFKSIPTRIAVSLATLGFAQIAAGQYAEAEPVLRECLAYRQQHEADGWRTFLTQSLLGGALVGQARFADRDQARAARLLQEAEPLLLQGYEGLKHRAAKIPSQQRANRLANAIAMIVALYEVWGKPAEAAKWRKELDELKAELGVKD